MNALEQLIPKSRQVFINLTVQKLNQIIDNASRSTRFTVLVTLILALPFLPHPTRRPQLPPLTPGVERIYLKAGDGRGLLELLVAKPSGSDDDDKSHMKAPLLFVHGGYGSAFCWKNWIPFFASRGRTVYALSLSGHGYSTRPFFFTIRTKSYFAKDVLVALEHIVSTNKTPGLPPPVLVGHSAGGGLSQYVVDVHGSELRKRQHISGLIGISPFPPQGGFRVYANWLIVDPWFPLRALFDPYFLLSTPRRVSRAFFGQHYCSSLHPTKNSLLQRGDTVPIGYMEQMTKEESIAWPNGMNYPFINTHRVLQNLTFVGGVFQTRIHLIAGRQDVLMSPYVMRLAQDPYACDLDLIDRGGHHLMLDEPWEEGAKCVEAKLQRWGI